jgi:hypothetical protein
MLDVGSSLAAAKFLVRLDDVFGYGELILRRRARFTAQLLNLLRDFSKLRRRLAAAKRAETAKSQCSVPAFAGQSEFGGFASPPPSAPPPRQESKAGNRTQYRADRRFVRLPSRSRKNAEAGMRLVGGCVMNDGRRLGTVRLAHITAAVVDSLFDRLLTIKKTDAQGNTVEIARRTTVNGAMRACRRAWNVAARSHPGKVPHANPFSAMGLTNTARETPTATFAELQAFREKTKAMGERHKHERHAKRAVIE